MNDMIFQCMVCRQYADDCHCTCKVCGGRGNTGRPYPCSRCGSTGRIRSLFGRVKECRTCHAKKEPCPSCGSSGKDQQCPKCHGTGKGQCPNCLGQGFIDVEATLKQLNVVPNSFRLFHQGVDDAVYGGVTGPCQTRTVEEIYQQLRLACDVPAGHSLKQRVSGIACPALLSSSN